VCDCVLQAEGAFARVFGAILQDLANVDLGLAVLLRERFDVFLALDEDFVECSG
jgi:hypothetical protein